MSGLRSDACYSHPPVGKFNEPLSFISLFGWLKNRLDGVLTQTYQKSVLLMVLPSEATKFTILLQALLFSVAASWLFWGLPSSLRGSVEAFSCSWGPLVRVLIPVTLSWLSDLPSLSEALGPDLPVNQNREGVLTWGHLVTLPSHYESVIEMNESVGVVTLYSYHKCICPATVSISHFHRWGRQGLTEVKWLEGNEFSQVCDAPSITIWDSHFNNVYCENKLPSRPRRPLR